MLKQAGPHILWNSLVVAVKRMNRLASAIDAPRRIHTLWSQAAGILYPNCSQQWLYQLSSVQNLGLLMIIVDYTAQNTGDIGKSQQQQQQQQQPQPQPQQQQRRRQQQPQQPQPQPQQQQRRRQQQQPPQPV